MIAVYAGPSLAPHAISDPRIVWRPPAQRDDLRAACDDARLTTIVLIDGLFHSTLAVGPREVRDVAGSGVRIIGAASMGALRAAECRPVQNVEGLGLIERLYRWRVIDADDEVAVVTDPDEHYRSVTAALIDVRIAVRRAVRRGTIERAEAGALVDAAEQLPYYQRTWSAITRTAGVERSRVDHLTRDSQKRVDAMCATEYALATDGDTRRHRAPHRPRPGSRYGGYDQRLGWAPGDDSLAVLHWLVGSGRYVRHVWPLLNRVRTVGQPHDPAATRDAAWTSLAELLADERQAARDLARELDYSGEMPRLLAWLTACRVVDAGRACGPAALTLAWEQIGIRHGYAGAGSMLDDVRDDFLSGVVPMSWLREAAELEARRLEVGAAW